MANIFVKKKKPRTLIGESLDMRRFPHERPTRSEKLRTAERVAAWHFKVQRGLREVYYVEPDEHDDTPIKLLEVNNDTMATGDVTPFFFAATDDVPYMTAVAEITPDELKHFKAHPDELPQGWSLSRAKVFQRSSTTSRRL